MPVKQLSCMLCTILALELAACALAGLCRARTAAPVHLWGLSAHGQRMDWLSPCADEMLVYTRGRGRLAMSSAAQVSALCLELTRGTLRADAGC